MSDATETREISLTLNGRKVTTRAGVRTLLVDFLRHDLHRTGTHVGCAHGACGACTVVVDGTTMRSCLMLAVQADGAEIETIEGLAEGAALSKLQEAFRANHALQCGFCTPGMLMSAKTLLAENPNPTEHEIRDAMAGNLCRCTGYTPIVRAIQQTARQTPAE